jgi:DNA gyrase/topoisomerase IV subunit A
MSEKLDNQDENIENNLENTQDENNQTPLETPTGIVYKGDSNRSIRSEMETCYLDYAMSVIVSRALPDIRD